MQHHRHGDVADFGNSEPRNGLAQGNDCSPRAHHRRVRDAHDLARQREVRLDQLGQLSGVDRLLRGELGELRADTRQRSDVLRGRKGILKILPRRLAMRQRLDKAWFAIQGIPPDNFYATALGSAGGGDA